MKKKVTGLLAIVLALALLLPAVPAKAAAAPRLNVTKKTITGIGKKATLTVSGLPAGVTTVWGTSNKTVATITKVSDKKATVTAKKKGAATITAILRKNGKVTKKLTCKVTVKQGKVPATGIKISNAKIDADSNAHVIQMGTTYDFDRKLISSVQGVASTDKTYWIVEDPSIASVKSNGLVTPLKEGSTHLIVCCGKNKTEALANYSNATKYDKIKLVITYPKLSFTHSLIGSTRLTLAFSQAMKTDTLVTADGKLTENITITPKVTDGKTASAPGTLKASFDDTKKVLTIEASKKFDGEYDISLSSKITSEGGTPLEAVTLAVTLKDLTGPSYLGSTTDDTGVIASIKFNEPIDVEYLRPSNPRQGSNSISYSVLAEKENYILSEDKMSLSIDLSSLANHNKQETYTVDLYGIRDLAGNVSNPYPLTVQLYTDTTPKPQAVCKGVRRNGNSLIATFDKAIQSPGYAEVKNVYLSGSVNPANRKEVIYSLSGTGLTTMTGTVSVELEGFSSYNVSSSSNTHYATSVNFSAQNAIFKITDRTLTTDSSNHSVLTLTYDSDVSVLSSSGELSASSNINGIIGVPSSYSYKAAAKGKVVTITFTSGFFTESGIYTFTLPEGFVMDNYNNLSKAAAVTVTKTSGSSLVLPAPSAIMTDFDDPSVIYITFDALLDVTSATSLSNYSIAGLSISSVSLLTNTPGCPAVVQLILSESNKVKEGIPYPVRISGIKGYMGSYDTMDTYTEMVVLSNKKTLPIEEKIALSSSDTLTITLQNRGAGHISYTFTTSNGKTLVPDHTSNTGTQITFTFPDKTLTKGMQITAAPTSDNIIIDANGNQVLNLPFTVTVQ